MGIPLHTSPAAVSALYLMGRTPVLSDLENTSFRGKALETIKEISKVREFQTTRRCQDLEVIPCHQPGEEGRAARGSMRVIVEVKAGGYFSAVSLSCRLPINFIAGQFFPPHVSRPAFLDRLEISDLCFMHNIVTT